LVVACRQLIEFDGNPSAIFSTEPFVTEELNRLLEQALRIGMTPAEQKEQRRSFAYGNTKIENDLVTREMIDEAAERLSTPKNPEDMGPR
jgi:hypothetical protein